MLIESPVSISPKHISSISLENEVNYLIVLLREHEEI
jgi:hypothetical protein